MSLIDYVEGVLIGIGLLTVVRAFMWAVDRIFPPRKSV